MVRKSLVTAPVLPVALSALAAFYFLREISFIFPVTVLVLILFFASLSIICLFNQFFLLENHLFSKINSTKQTPHFSNRSLIVSICAGVILASICFTQFSFSRAPCKSLLPDSKWVSFTGTAIGDLRNWGESNRAIDVQSIAVKDSFGGEYSASGRLTVVLPVDLALSALPGGIADKSGTRVFLSRGLPIQVHGRCKIGPDGSTFFYADSFESYRLQNTNIGFKKNSLSNFRVSLRLTLFRLLYSWGNHGGLLLALLSGSREYLSVSVAENFKLSGLSHVLALSGMHLSILAGVALGAGTRLGGKKLGLRLSLPVMLFFVWFAGASPSLLRALLMSVLSFLCSFAGIITGPLSLLCGAIILQMIIVPADIVSIAFMLSALALAGILIIGNGISTILSPWIPRFFSSPLAASIGAQCSTAPIAAVTFGMLSPVGIFASIFAGPAASLFLVAGLCAVPIALVCPFLEPLCGHAMALLYRLAILPADVFSRVHPLSFHSTIATILASTVPVILAAIILFISARISKWRTPVDSFSRL